MISKLNPLTKDVFLSIGSGVLTTGACQMKKETVSKQPNILIAIFDDQ